MSGTTSFESSGRQRRKSRFDDPNPAKRSGFSDSQDGSQTHQSPPNNSHTGFVPNSSPGFQADLTNVDRNVPPNVGFQPHFIPPTQPPPAFQQFMPPGPNLAGAFPPNQPFNGPNPFPSGQQFPSNQFVPSPQPNYDPSVLNELKDKEDLDSCNVGIMASVLMKYKKKGDFVPYRPIDNLDDIPKKCSIQPITEVGLVLKNRVEDFYDELEDIFQQYKAEIDPNDVKYDYSRRTKFNLNRHLTQPIKIVSQEELMNPAKRELYVSTPILPDAYGLGGREGIGMGSGEDLFESFRRKRSSKYHESYAIRESVRKDPNCIVISSSELCYSCNQPGHYAKDCKYGII